MDVRNPTAPPGRAQLALLRDLGYADVQHDSHVPLLSHLIGTRRVLATWGERPAVAEAGLFHSVYGTEYFGHDRPADREAVRSLIGAEAEGLVWLWCSIRRDTLHPGTPSVVEDWRSDTTIELDTRTTADLVTLWAADTVEQLGRMADDDVGFADGLPAVLHLARPAARVEARRVLDRRG